MGGRGEGKAPAAGEGKKLPSAPAWCGRPALRAWTSGGKCENLRKPSLRCSSKDLDCVMLHEDMSVSLSALGVD